MRYALIASAILLSAILGAQAYADAGTASGTSATAGGASQVAAQHKASKSAHVRSSASQSSGNVVTYNRDSKDPNIGWHTVNGLRSCTQDCDNPEIPGSGYTCRDVNFLGMAMRDCEWSSF
jgi:hypothetical protein